MNNYHAKINEAFESLKLAGYEQTIETAFILGSGLDGLLKGSNTRTVISYNAIKNFPTTSAPSHKGQLVISEFHQKNVAFFQGRFHLYEGYHPKQIALPIYLAKRMGAKRIIITNAAGALNSDYKPGEIMLITDHINFTGQNPLIGENDSRLGLRFPDMSNAYDKDLQQLAIESSKKSGIDLHQGIYAAVSGPSLETSAERRFLHAAGADAVGMSTAMEVIAANHCELPVLAFSAISNCATGSSEQTADTIEDVLHFSALAGEKIGKLLEEIMAS